MTLEQFFQEHPKAAIAFSGGADSAFLLWAAKYYRCDVHAYYVRTTFQPEFELHDALALADELSIPMTIIETDILSIPEVAENGLNRCYHCKKALFGKIKERAGQDGYPILLDGTNASDDANDRPGMQAIKELRVCSPLRECGITKAEIRGLSRQAGLFTWNKPAYACLATRIPTDLPITEEQLKKIEQAEQTLFQMGFSDFRIRFTKTGGAHIQVTETQFASVFQKRKEIFHTLQSDFSSVSLDLKPRPTSICLP